MVTGNGKSFRKGGKTGSFLFRNDQASVQRDIATAERTEPAARAAG
jgi:hypothetical protein